MDMQEKIATLRWRNILAFSLEAGNNLPRQGDWKIANYYLFKSISVESG